MTPDAARARYWREWAQGTPTWMLQTMLPHVGPIAAEQIEAVLHERDDSPTV